jgi:hypothetical protein
MLTFASTSDPYSLDVRRDGRFVGDLLWHPANPPQFRPMCAMADCYLTLDEMKQLLTEYEKATGVSTPVPTPAGRQTK